MPENLLPFSEPLKMILFLIVFIFPVIPITIKSIRQRAYNKRQPVISAEAQVVEYTDSIDPETYYATFLVTGKHLKFCLGAFKPKWLYMGARGILTYQGTRFIGFEWRPGQNPSLASLYGLPEEPSEP